MEPIVIKIRISKQVKPNTKLTLLSRVLYLVEYLPKFLIILESVPVWMTSARTLPEFFITAPLCRNWFKFSGIGGYEFTTRWPLNW